MGSLFGSDSPQPALPIMTPPPVMPDTDPQKKKRSMQRGMARRTAASGRDSTILASGDADVLGG